MRYLCIGLVLVTLGGSQAATAGSTTTLTRAPNKWRARTARVVGRYLKTGEAAGTLGERVAYEVRPQTGEVIWRATRNGMKSTRVFEIKGLEIKRSSRLVDHGNGDISGTVNLHGRAHEIHATVQPVDGGQREYRVNGFRLLYRYDPATGRTVKTGENRVDVMQLEPQADDADVVRRLFTAKGNDWRSAR